MMQLPDMLIFEEDQLFKVSINGMVLIVEKTLEDAEKAVEIFIKNWEEFDD